MQESCVAMNKIDDNLWKEIFSFLQPQDFHAALLTCKAWSVHSRNELLKHTVLCNLTEVNNRRYTDFSCKELESISRAPARRKGVNCPLFTLVACCINGGGGQSPTNFLFVQSMGSRGVRTSMIGAGKLLVTKYWSYPGPRCYPSHFEAIIAGSPEHKVTSYSSPDRCNNYSLELDDEELRYYASSLGSITLGLIRNETTYSIIVCMSMIHSAFGELLGNSKSFCTFTGDHITLGRLGPIATSRQQGQHGC